MIEEAEVNEIGQMSIDQLSIDYLRMLAIDAVQKANSGHPGLPLGAAPMAYVLWTKFLRYHPSNPQWFNRDRFVLSAGHGSALLYSLLHLAGYDLSMDDIKQFRQPGSKTPGHPERTVTPGVEVTTGPLGQGFGNGVGMAMAEAHLSALYNRPDFPVVDHYTYGIVSDGDLMEGLSSEAASLAGHLKLGKLIYLYDDNHISLDGPTSLAFTENVPARFDAYGWHTQVVEDGNDTEAIENAIKQAQNRADKPSLIAVKTVIGYGSPLQNTSKVHGSAMGEENVAKTKVFYHLDPAKKFFIPASVKEHMLKRGKDGYELEKAWNSIVKTYRAHYPEESDGFRMAVENILPAGWTKDLPEFSPREGNLATRQASGKFLESAASKISWIFGGSADLASSNEMTVKPTLSFQPGHYEQPHIWFGVREHAMGAILNGIAAHGGLLTYGGTFLTFSDYMKGAIRLAALSHLPVTYVFTHDSIGLGEDGPTHQPIEQVGALRMIPNLVTIRPGDVNETVEAWKFALARKDGPVALILCRQKIPVTNRDVYAPASNTAKGAYVIREAGGPIDVLFIATGSELFLTLEAAELLEKEGIFTRVVSMPSWELFEAQSTQYKNEVLPPKIKNRISVEALSPFGWERYVGSFGRTIGINRFGESGPGEQVLQLFGFTVEAMVKHAKDLLDKNKVEQYNTVF